MPVHHFKAKTSQRRSNFMGQDNPDKSRDISHSSYSVCIMLILETDKNRIRKCQVSSRRAEETKRKCITSLANRTRDHISTYRLLLLYYNLTSHSLKLMVQKTETNKQTNKQTNKSYNYCGINLLKTSLLVLIYYF